jgi:hypothetical protein
MSDPTSNVRPADREVADVGAHTGTEPDWDWNNEPDYTETKAFFRTSEFWFAVLGVVAVLLAAYNEGRDSMTRDDGWRYATAILIGYMVARGLAKAGTKEPTDRR